jgi:hypothetical protein
VAVVAALVPVLLAAAGRVEAQGVGIGVKGGYLYSSFDFENASDVLDSSSGWMAGLFIGGNRAGRVGLMGEINLQAKRGEAGMESATIYYAQVPLLLRINVGSRSTGGVGGYGVVGPAIDLKIGDDLGNLTTFDDIESGDVSLVVGVGVELSRFIIEGRGTWGLRSIATDADGLDVTTNAFALLVGLRFN